MVKPFDDAVFAMKSGEISNVVESDFGFHIIQLTGVRGGDKKPFDQVRAEIEAEVRKSLAQKKYAEAAEQFTEHGLPAVRQPAAGDRQAQAREAQRHRARAPAPGASGPLASEKLLRRCSATRRSRTSATPTRWRSARTRWRRPAWSSTSPARTLPLADVKDRVRAAVVPNRPGAGPQGGQAPAWQRCRRAATPLVGDHHGLAQPAAEVCRGRCWTRC
jgi:peptidyl-prolyl cis-trans isomerase D